MQARCARRLKNIARKISMVKRKNPAVKMKAGFRERTVTPFVRYG